MATSKHTVRPLLDIQRPAFAEHYERGVWWSMYGDEQGNGPLSISYLTTNLKRYHQQRYFERQDPYWRDHIGFYLGMYHGAVLSPQTGHLLPGVSALICFDHPQAIRGYQHGRHAAFHEPGPPYRYNEDSLLDLLHEIVREASHWKKSEATDTWTHALGCLLGELSLRQTQLAYRDGLNAVSQYAFAHGKTSSAVKLHKGMYPELRMHYRLPSQLACSVERQVAATYKGLWTKLLKNLDHLRLKITKKRFKGLDKPPKYSSPTVQYTYERDYTFQCESRVSIKTLNGRVSIPYQGYYKHLLLIQQGAHIARIGDAKLWYDQPKKQFYLLVSLEIAVPEPTCDDLNETVGVDVGVRYLAVTSTAAGKATFSSGKRVRHRANHYARLRKRLQKKGTRGAKRRLRRIGQRERRLKLQANHQVATQIITAHPHALIGLEQLTGIRESKRRRKRKRKRNDKGTEKVSPKTRKANRVYSQWSFAELHTLISYKAALSGSLAIKVDADYTSKGCPRCGHVADENRPGKGLLFTCQNPMCGYILHADLVGARNLVMRTLVLRQGWSTTGLLSMAPDASDREAKAARLTRYAELRYVAI